MPLISFHSALQIGGQLFCYTPWVTFCTLNTTTIHVKYWEDSYGWIDKWNHVLGNIYWPSVIMIFVLYNTIWERRLRKFSISLP